MVQDVLTGRTEDEARDLMSSIIDNAGPHYESSGSAPIQKLRSGEVAVGFGLRHQAVRDKNDGLPIDYVDPIEGNYSLTESIAVIDKGENTNPLAMEMAECIIKNGRAEIQQTYPNPIYEGETVPENSSEYPKEYSEPLTVELLEEHTDFVESAK